MRNLFVRGNIGEAIEAIKQDPQLSVVIDNEGECLNLKQYYVGDFIDVIPCFRNEGLGNFERVIYNQIESGKKFYLTNEKNAFQEISKLLPDELILLTQHNEILFLCATLSLYHTNFHIGGFDYHLLEETYTSFGIQGLKGSFTVYNQIDQNKKKYEFKLNWGNPFCPLNVRSGRFQPPEEYQKIII